MRVRSPSHPENSIDHAYSLSGIEIFTFALPFQLVRLSAYDSDPGGVSARSFDPQDVMNGYTGPVCPPVRFWCKLEKLGSRP
jgi:hypothetical protein